MFCGADIGQRVTSALRAIQGSSADQRGTGLGSLRNWVWVEEGGHRAFSLSYVSRHG